MNDETILANFVIWSIIIMIYLIVILYIYCTTAKDVRKKYSDISIPSTDRLCVFLWLLLFILVPFVLFHYMDKSPGVLYIFMSLITLYTIFFHKQMIKFESKNICAIENHI